MADEKQNEILASRIDALTNRVAELVRELAEKERIEDRAEREEERIQDKRHDALVTSIDGLTKAMTRPNIESLRNMGWAAEGNGPAPAPIALVPHRKDDSLAIETDHEGDKVAVISFGVKLKRVVPFIIAAAVSLLEAWHLISSTGHGH